MPILDELKHRTTGAVRELIAGDESRPSSQLDVYRHAFETTRVDRDRIQAELDKARALIAEHGATADERARLRSELNRALELIQHYEAQSGTTPAVTAQSIVGSGINPNPEAHVPVGGYVLPDALERRHFATLLEWIRGIADHPATQALEVGALWDKPAHSTIGSVERSILYTLMRAIKPRNALEIGTYFAGTTQLLAAAARQDQGMTFSIDPYGAARVPLLMMQWPQGLRNHVAFKPVFSTQFLGPTEGYPAFELIFVDGDHRFPNVLHDLFACHDNLRHGGLMVVDNAELSDVMDACLLFKRENPDYEAVAVHHWLPEPGERRQKKRITADLAHTDAPVCFVILAKPAVISLGQRPLIYNITNIKALAPAPLHIRGTSTGPARLRVSVDLRGYMQASSDPRAMNVKHVRDIEVGQGAFHEVVRGDGALLAEYQGRTITAEIIVTGEPADGTIRDIGVTWGDVPLAPYRNALAD